MAVNNNVFCEQKVVKETFSLAEVPKDALYLGLAGVLPYLATSLSTVYLAYDLNHAKVHGFGVFLDADAAAFGLQLVQPIQIGYGAVVRRLPMSALLALPLTFPVSRSSLSLAPSIGASNGRAFADIIPGIDTRLA